MTAAAALAAVNFNNSHHANNNNHGPNSASNSPMKTATVQYTPIAQKVTRPPSFRTIRNRFEIVLGIVEILKTSKFSMFE